MDKTKKFLRKLSGAKQDEVYGILFKIESGKTQSLDIKKLKGHNNLFRVRVGDIRIVFYQNKKVTGVLFIGERGNSKYEQL